MSREPILNELPPDWACAIALGLIENPRFVVSLDAVTLHDAHMHPISTQADWLSPDDPHDQVTREYLQARREAMAVNTKRSGAAWAAAHATKLREAANQRAAQAKVRGHGFLAERGVLKEARAAGWTVLA